MHRRNPSRTRQSRSNDTRAMNHMARQINAISNRIERRIAEAHGVEATSGSLLVRAQRLNDRLDILKHKLRMCFDLSNEVAPESLQNVLQQMAEAEPEDAPHEYICPITQCVMVDPVATSDGKIYDRAAILEWFANFPEGKEPTSPLTNLPLSSLELTPQNELRVQIQTFLRNETQPGSKPAQPEPKSKPAVDAVSSGPIWSSSVVPTTEPNSRVLNMLRVTDDVSMPVEIEDTSTPIWGSSVVPPTEPNSRMLNMLRVDNALPVPEARNVMETRRPSNRAPAASATKVARVPPKATPLPARHRTIVSAANRRVQSSGLYSLPASPPRNQQVSQRQPPIEPTVQPIGQRTGSRSSSSRAPNLNTRRTRQ